MSTASSKAPPKPTAAIFTLMISLGVGGVAGYLVARTGMQNTLIQERLHALAGWDLLVLPLLFLLVLAVHEVGHLLGGFSRGMRFLLLIIGPFKFSQTPAGIRFNWVFSLGTFGGLAAATPDPARPIPAQLKRLIVGGPLASLMLAAVAICAGIALEGRPGAYALIVGSISMLIFLATALPFRAGGFMSDGMQLLEVMRGGQAVEERLVLTTLVAQSLAGVRPRDLDQAAIAKAVEAQSSEPLRRIAARLLAYFAAVDRSDAEVSDQHAAWLADHVDHYPQGFRQSITIELCLHAAQRGDLIGARAWMARSSGGVVDAARRALAEAALSELDHHWTDATAALARARSQLANSMDPGASLLTADQIDTALMRLNQNDRTAS